MERYSAFLSYSHADQAVARWLHRSLETYRLPRALVGTTVPGGDVPRRLQPVFRDREELPASGDLGEEIRSALAASRFLIVICSPRSAASKWVNEEIISFKRLHGEARVLAVIVDGEPYAGGADECFAPALRFRLAPDGNLSSVAAEPIAADLRHGKDGRRLALLKLVAGLTGVSLDALAQRDAARRQRQLAIIASLSLLIAAVTIGLAIYAESQRRTAESQRRLADKSLAFLIDTFAIANPATENPRTITALTILGRASRRANEELADETAVGAKLLATTGEIFFNLGLQKEAERDLRRALARQPERSEQRARIMLKLADLAYKRGDPRTSGAWVERAAGAYEPAEAAAAQLQARVTESRAMVAFLDGNYRVAANGLGDAARQYALLDGDFREDLGRVWINQARSVGRTGEVGRADSLYAAAVVAWSGKFGANHVLTADAIRNQALAQFEAGRVGSASLLMDRAAATYAKVLEGDHPTIAAAAILTGRILTGRDDVAGALQAFERARGMFVRLYGPRNAAVGDVDFYAAEAEAKRGNIEAALARAARTKLIYDASYGPDDPDQVELLMLRTRILVAGGRLVEARRECAAGVALKRKIDPRDRGIAAAVRTCTAIETERRKSQGRA